VQIAPTKSEAYDLLEVDDYGMKHAQFINLILPERKKGIHP
jgi:hypothetical protein